MNSKGSASGSLSVRFKNTSASPEVDMPVSLKSTAGKGIDAPGKRSGIGWPMAAFFLIAQMAGAGFLSLPMALRNTGWMGIALMTIFCVAVGLSGTRLGICWVILEERWPDQYARTFVRQPYMEIAAKAFGKLGGQLSMAAVLVTVLGASTVFIILAAQMTIQLVGSTFSTCELILIYGGALTPLVWLGTPKDFWQASILAVVSTVIACAVVFVEVFYNKADAAIIQYPNPTVSSFSLGFGAILFAFGGASTFPTIQNDMIDRSDFWKSVTVAFASILSLYLPVATAGYALQGSTVGSNIMLSIEFNTIVECALIMEIVNLLGTYIISFNPAGQAFEEICNIPAEFGPKRILLRSAIVAVQVLVALAVPDFGLVLNLMGGSTVTFCSFILPPIMYMRLIDNCSDPKWPKRTIPLWERIALWEIVIVGVVGGITSTVSAFMAILAPDSFSQSCFTSFT